MLAMLAALCYQGYSNYTSYPPQRKASPCHRKHKAKDEIDIFFKSWNPVGRQKPAFGFFSKHGGNRNGTKYAGQEQTPSERNHRRLQWGM